MSESKQMQEFKVKVQDLVSKYEEKLSSVGIKITVAKRYFEEFVHGWNNYSPNPGVRLISNVERYFYEKREQKYYKNEKNKYHCIILSVLPVENNIVRKDYCRDYSFVLRKVERAHIGQKPERILYEEDKILSKIEKRIQKIIKKAENYGSQKACADNYFDVIRYCSSLKYGYKNKMLGKDRSTWELIFGIGFGILAITVIVIVCEIISSLL